MKISELEHFGVKGMRWGVRRKSGPPSGDAKTADKLSQKVKAGGTKTLTNKQLKQYVERMRLEKQYKELAPESTRRKVGKFVGDLMLTTGKAEVGKLVANQAGKQIAKILASMR